MNLSFFLTSLFTLIYGTGNISHSPEADKGRALVEKVVQEAGDYNTLWNKHDVVYTYTYQTPDGKKDVSTEKYIFEGELSYGNYETHQRTFADLKGPIEQGYNGSEYWLKHNGTIVDDEKRLQRVAFNRPTNYYWFAMIQKLLDPGLIYEYIQEETIDGKVYDIVKISFEPQGDKPTDIYQVFINRKTNLIDQFLFTVADFGVIETPLLMKVEYETIDGIKIPSKRKYKQSDWQATVSDEPWIHVNWTNIKFNNGLKRSDFNK